MIGLSADIDRAFTTFKQLCSPYAYLKLQRLIEYVVRDTYVQPSSGSAKRFLVLREFQKFCDFQPHKLSRPSQTRWLFLQQVVDRTIEQYDALIPYTTNVTCNTDNY